MGVRNVWLLAIAVGITGHVFAQEPATAEAPIPATPASSGTLIHTLGAFFSVPAEPVLVSLDDEPVALGDQCLQR